jgi:F-type H+-transporting ATPase subunit epsilon
VADRQLTVRIVSPQKVVFEGESSALVIPAWDGKVGVLPGHAPLLALLGSGELSVELPGSGSRTFFVAGGVLKVESGHVTVLTEYAGDEPPAEPLHEAVVQPEDVPVGSTQA